MKRFLLPMVLAVCLYAKPYENLTLQEALRIAKSENLEINIAKFDEKVRKLDVKVANGYNFGKLDATVMGMRSNDAGNVFGFKLQSREASFADFGFDEFLAPLGGAMMMANNNALTPEALRGMSSILKIQPKKLNYPDARNHFLTKLSLMIPLYTGGKLSNYKKIAKEMVEMSKYDRQKVTAQKLFEIKKSFYDISLLTNFENNLLKIEENIKKLKNTIKEMKKEGYAKKTDILEVEAKLSDVQRMVNQTKAYKALAYEFLSFLLDNEVKSIKTIPLEAESFQIEPEEVSKRNRDVQKAKTGLKIQTKMVDVAKAAFKPEVGVFGEYSSSDDTLFGNFKEHDAYTVGFAFKYNLFNGGIDKAKLEQEKLKKLKVENQVALAKKGIALKAKKIQTEIKSYEYQIEALKKELELAKEIYKTYLERYKEGLASINDVLIKQSQQIEKLLKLQDVQNKRNAKILELEKLAYGEDK